MLGLIGASESDTCLQRSHTLSKRPLPQLDSFFEISFCG